MCERCKLARNYLLMGLKVIRDRNFEIPEVTYGMLAVAHYLDGVGTTPMDAALDLDKKYLQTTKEKAN